MVAESQGEWGAWRFVDGQETEGAPAGERATSSRAWVRYPYPGDRWPGERAVKPTEKSDCGSRPSASAEGAWGRADERREQVEN